MVKKLVTVVSSILLVTLLLSACGNTATGEATPTPTPTSQPTPKPTTAAAGTPDASPTAVEPATCEVYSLTIPVRPADDTDYVKGVDPEAATFTIIEYADFQCPACSAMAPVMSEFLKNHPDVRLVYRHFPLSFHANAQLAAEAAETAGAQGKFWEMHDLLFSRVSEWSELEADAAQAKMTDFAEELGLDAELFERDLKAGTYRQLTFSRGWSIRRIRWASPPRG